MRLPTAIRRQKLNDYIVREEVEGRIRIPVAPIIYSAYKWAVRCFAFCHIYPNYYVFSVLAFEDAALPLLRKSKWWTPEEYNAQVRLMERYQRDPSMAVLHPAVRQARAKFRRLVLLLEPYLDPTQMIDLDAGGGGPIEPLGTNEPSADAWGIGAEPNDFGGNPL